MKEQFLLLITSIIYLVAVINPPSKVLFLASIEPPIPFSKIKEITLKSTTFCILFLFIMAAFGQIIFTHIFKVHIDTIRVAGGIVMFMIGIQMLFQLSSNINDAEHREDVAIVPLAVPLTAGAGTIVVVNTMAAMNAPIITYLSILFALLINATIMLCSRPIGNFLLKYNFVRPVYRLTGLLLMCLATEMILNGLSNWFMHGATQLK